MTTMQPTIFIHAADNIVSQMWESVASMLSLELMCFLMAMGAYAVLAASRASQQGQGKFISNKVCIADPIDSSDEIEELDVEVRKESAEEVTEVRLESEELDNMCNNAPEEEVPQDTPEVVSDVSEDATEVVSDNSAIVGSEQSEFYNDGLRLLDEVAKGDSDQTRSISVKLLSHARKLDQFTELLQSLETQIRPGMSQPEITEKRLPRLALVIARATAVQNRCINEIAMTGKFPQLKAVCRTLKKHGFVKNCNDDKFPLNGHWETEHGMNVIIEGKIVRWSQKRASKLKFDDASRSSCSLSLYGEDTVGKLVAPTAAGVSKTLQWDNGDIWHSSGGCKIANSVVYSSQMTKVLRDASQDHAMRKQTYGKLQLLCKEGFSLLPNCLLDQVLGFIGSDSYYVRVHFESKDGPPWGEFFGLDDDSFLGFISRHHPQVGFRHCWANAGSEHCGQRTLMQGQELQEDEFCRLVNDCKSSARR